MTTRPTSIDPSTSTLFAKFNAEIKPTKIDLFRDFNVTSRPKTVVTGLFSTLPNFRGCATSMPGERHPALAVTANDIKSRFPGASFDVIEKTKSILNGIFPELLTVDFCLSFGAVVQDELSRLVKHRLRLMETSDIHAVTKHLHTIKIKLSGVASAMSGGFLKRGPLKVWESISDEVNHLELVLINSVPNLKLFATKIDTMLDNNSNIAISLDAYHIAIDFLIQHIETLGKSTAAQLIDILTSRSISIKTSRALVNDQEMMLELEKLKLQELIIIVQDNVLLKLPTVYSHLATLQSTMTDTQKFIITEAIESLTQEIK